MFFTASNGREGNIEGLLK